MTPKRLLNKIEKDQQEYYIFLVKECFLGFSNAGYNFGVCIVIPLVMHGLFIPQFFWKSLTILSGNYFEPKHKASQADIAKISKI